MFNYVFQVLDFLKEDKIFKYTFLTLKYNFMVLKTFSSSTEVRL